MLKFGGATVPEREISGVANEHELHTHRKRPLLNAFCAIARRDKLHHRAEEVQEADVLFAAGYVDWVRLSLVSLCR